MKKNIKELAAKAVEFCTVSEQNRDVWVAGFAAGAEYARAYACRIVAQSCEQIAKFYESSLKNAKTEE